MRIIIFITALAFRLCIQGQSNEIKKMDCLVLIDQKFTGDLNLYSKNGKIIKKLHNNLKDEDYVIIKIIGKNDTMFEVVASYAIAGPISNGWIKKNNKVIGVFSRAYSSELPLYKFPEKKSEINSTVKDYTPNFFHVYDCQNNWLFVDSKIGDQTYTGWMDPNTQCANPYTNCN